MVKDEFPYHPRVFRRRSSCPPLWHVSASSPRIRPWRLCPRWVRCLPGPRSSSIRHSRDESDSSPPNFRLIARLADSISTPYSLTYLSSSSMSSFSVTFSSSTLFSSSTWGVSSSLFILPTLLLRGGLGQPPVFPIEGSLNKFLQGVTESRSPSRCRRFGGSIPKVTFK